MKKFLLIPILVTTIILFAFDDYGPCSGVSGHKALACSSCHGGVVAGNVWDGKLTPDGFDPTLFEYELVIPTKEASVLQISSGILDEVTKVNPRISIEDATDIYANDLETVFNATEILHRKNGADFTTLKVKVEFDEKLEEDQTFVIQGVYSNNDGTIKGDQTFYQEVIIEASHKNQNSSLIAPINIESFYNNNQVHISTEKNTSVRIMDVLGKTLYQSLTEGNSKIDVSNFHKGAYFVLIGNSGKDMETFQFVK